VKKNKEKPDGVPGQVQPIVRASCDLTLVHRQVKGLLKVKRSLEKLADMIGPDAVLDYPLVGLDRTTLRAHELVILPHIDTNAFKFVVTALRTAQRDLDHDVLLSFDPNAPRED
jgi:hypothetical protein